VSALILRAGCCWEVPDRVPAAGPHPVRYRRRAGSGLLHPAGRLHPRRRLPPHPRLPGHPAHTARLSLLGPDRSRAHRRIPWVRTHHSPHGLRHRSSSPRIHRPRRQGQRHPAQVIDRQLGRRLGARYRPRTPRLRQPRRLRRPGRQHVGNPGDRLPRTPRHQRRTKLTSEQPRPGACAPCFSAWQYDSPRGPRHAR
jgi:hypothetical protein